MGKVELPENCEVCENNPAIKGDFICEECWAKMAQDLETQLDHMNIVSTSEEEQDD